MSDTFRGLTVILTTAVVLCGILSAVHFGANTPEDQINGPEKFANSSLVAAMTLTGFLILGLYLSAQTILETPDQMNLLLLGQGLFMLISGIILVFVIMNIKFG